MAKRKEKMKRKTIGILGGMGAEATVDLYLGIWRYYQENYGAKYDSDFPPVIIYSVPIPDVVESVENEQKTLEMLQEAAITLKNAGCDFLVIACNTVQFLLTQIRQVITIPVLSIAEVNAEYLKDKGFSKVGILSTKTTIKKKIYGSALASTGIKLLTPSSQDQEIVTGVIIAQLAGKTTKNETKKLQKIINNLKTRGAEAILLACTDLPLVIKQEDTNTLLINCTEIYANEAARLSVGDT